MDIILSYKQRPRALIRLADAQAGLCLCCLQSPEDRISVVDDLLFIFTPIVGVCNCWMFYCTPRYAPSGLAIILMGKKVLVSLLSLCSCCLVIAVQLFLVVPSFCLQFVIVVFPDHIYILFFSLRRKLKDWKNRFSINRFRAIEVYNYHIFHKSFYRIELTSLDLDRTAY